jgi:hypothetical protein
MPPPEDQVSGDRYESFAPRPSVTRRPGAHIRPLTVTEPASTAPGIIQPLVPTHEEWVSFGRYEPYPPRRPLALVLACPPTRRDTSRR